MSGGTKKKENTTAEGAPPTTVVTTTTDENVFSSSFDDYEPSVTLSVFVYWILPILVIVCMSRFLVDPTALSGLGIGPISDDSVPVVPKPAPAQPPSSVPSNVSPTPERPKRKPTPVPTQVAEKPTSYIEAVQGITRRRLNWEETDSSKTKGYDRSDLESTYYSESYGTTTTTASTSSSSAPPTPERLPLGASTDPMRNQMRAMIDGFRNNYQEDPDNLFKAIELADTLRLYDVQYHDGGTAQQEGQKMYKAAISLALVERERKLELGEDTKSENVPEEIMLSTTSKSIDGILCALYTNLGKVYFMSNMFERAVESYTKALDVEPMYLDAMSARGSSRLILGHYEGGALDFTTVRENDTGLRFLDVYTGLSRILEARESVVPGGWAPIIEGLNRLIPELEAQHMFLQNGPQRTLVAKTLNRLYLVLFLYHDIKTKDTNLAWDNLSKAYEFKMTTLEPWNSGFETQKVSTTKQIFQKGFWPKGVGSQTETPIFIIGFVRSGSTLLERVLDAHPKIVGTGENSVFNGQLDDIRNKIVESSLSGNAEALANIISSLADGVVDEMRERWEMGFSGDRTDDQPDPERFADKMLTNYYNVGFIHMMFPKALILHVVREPMDTIFSAYKHEFPQGTLDYTSDFPSLADLYHAYRDLMDHWDRELPGRVTHIRYEDMVHDMPGVARKIIEATDLEWNNTVLDFHLKKHAVNTLSTTQVRKGVYKDSLQAWKRYESHLGPLLKLIGERTTYDIKTALPGYVRPPPTPPGDEKVEEEEDEEEAAGDVDTTTEAAAISLEEAQGESDEEEETEEDVPDADSAETVTTREEAVEKSDEEEETEEDSADDHSAETATTPEESAKKSDEEEGTEEEDVADDHSTETTTTPEEAVENSYEEEGTEEEDVTDDHSTKTTTTPEEAVENSYEEEETEEEDVADVHSTETTTTPEEAVKNSDEEEETEEEDVADDHSAETTTTPEEAVEKSNEEEETEEEDVANDHSTETTTTPEEAVEKGDEEEETEEEDAADDHSTETTTTPEEAVEKGDEEEETEEEDVADDHSTKTTTTPKEAVEKGDEEEETEEDVADDHSTETTTTPEEAVENSDEEEETEEEDVSDVDSTEATITSEEAQDTVEEEEEEVPAVDVDSAEAAEIAEGAHEEDEAEADSGSTEDDSTAEEEEEEEADIGSTEDVKTTEEAPENDEEEEEEEPAADTGMADDISTAEEEESDLAADTSSAEAATTAEEVYEKGEEEAAAANDGLTEADEEVNKEEEDAEEEVKEVKDEL